MLRNGGAVPGGGVEPDVVFAPVMMEDASVGTKVSFECESVQGSQASEASRR